MIKLYMSWGDLYLTLRFLFVWVEAVLTTLAGLLIHVDQAWERTPINPLLPTLRHHSISGIRDILEPALFFLFFFFIIHSWDIKVSCILSLHDKFQLIFLCSLSQVRNKEVYLSVIGFTSSWIDQHI